MNILILKSVSYILISSIGIITFIYLKNRLRKSGMPNPPVIESFFVITIYTILLLTLLTGLLWEWSVFAFLGVIFVSLPAPILMAFISIRLGMHPNLSRWHFALLNACWYYFLIFPVSLFLLFTYAK